tara:strand:- start:67598 stop:68182 length:585 start_codon:yes stop_codon:yes gene_type:complete
MISKMTGTVEKSYNNLLELKINNITYDIHITDKDEKILSKKNDNDFVTVFIFHEIKEDQQNLYGFLEKTEKELFTFLIMLKGLGGKTVLNILGNSDPEKIINMIHNQDFDKFSQFPKIGKKTAEKILTEAKHKIKKLNISKISKTTYNQEVIDKAILGLTSLGYNENLAKEKTKELYVIGMNVQELIEIVIKDK